MKVLTKKKQRLLNKQAKNNQVFQSNLIVETNDFKYPTWFSNDVSNYRGNS